jgi:hypothetical protein
MSAAIRQGAPVSRTRDTVEVKEIETEPGDSPALRRLQKRGKGHGGRARLIRPQSGQPSYLRIATMRDPRILVPVPGTAGCVGSLRLGFGTAPHHLCALAGTLLFIGQALVLNPEHPTLH